MEISGRLNTHGNTHGYKDILEQVLVPTANLVFGGEPIFVQDNSSIHNAHIVQAWISEQNGLHLIKMPPKREKICAA